MMLQMTQTLVIPRPEPLPLPAPPWLLWTLLIATFLLHVLAMNAILGGSILAVVARYRASKNHELLSRSFFKLLPVAVAATITLGVPPLLFVQVLYGRLLYSSSILMGWYWLSVIPLLLLACYGACVLAFQKESSSWSRLIWLVAVVFLVIAFIFTNNMSLMLRPGVFAEKYLENAKGFHLNLDDSSLLPRYVHNVVSAIAVASLGVALLGLFRRKEDPEFGRWAIRQGAVWFGMATVVNLAVGAWYLFSLSRDTLLALMNPTGVLALMVGIMGALVSVFLAMQAVNSGNPGLLVKGSLAVLLVGLLGMILLRDQLRQVYLSQAGYEIVKWVVPDWGTTLIFVALFALAVGAAAWMVRALVQGNRNAGD